MQLIRDVCVFLGGYLGCAMWHCWT